MRGSLVMITAALLLIGCFDEQKRQFYQCQTEAMRHFPGDTYGRGAAFVESCMGAAGYEIEYRARDVFCRANDPSRVMTASCYAPAAPLARWAQSVELWF